MQLSDWFTIIAILLAVLAFFSQAERKVLLHKINRWLIGITAIVLFFIIPFLLFYRSLANVFTFLNDSPFSFQNRFLPGPSDWAFILIFISIGYWMWWFSIRLKKVKPTEQLINHYIKSMNTMPFEDLFRLFIKYEETQLEESANFKIYSSLLASEMFFNSALDYNPKLFIGIISNLDAKTILDSELPVVIRDKVNAIAAEQSRLGTVSLYNYEPIYHDKWPKEDLLLFHLTDCYFALMKSCIRANVFYSNHFRMINFFSETMFSEILKSIHIPESVDIDKETPTYNHKLLTNILSAHDEWISLANELKREYFVTEHFVELYCGCISKLIKYNEEIISDRYLKIQFNSFLRSTYFDNQLSNIDEIRNKIDSIFQSSIPSEFQLKAYYKVRFETCWDYSDDEIFAGDSGVQNHEITMRNRFIKNVVEKIRNS
jgi:hypothetical protein